MYKPQGLYKTKPLSKIKTYIPKTLLIFFFIMHLCFGINLGFIKYLNKTVQPWAKCETVIVSLFISVVLCSSILATSDVMNTLWFSTNFVQCILNFVFLNCSKYNFADLIIDLIRIDGDVPDVKRKFLGIFAFLYAFLPWVGEYVFGYFRCNIQGEMCLNSPIPYPVYSLLLFSIDAISVIFILIYYYMYCYVNKIKEMTKESKIRLQQVERGYLDLTDCYDKIKPLYNKLITVELVFEVPRLMCMVYAMLRYIKQQKTWIFYLTEAFYSVPVILHFVAPSIATEMLNSQNENLKLILNKKLLEEKDEKTKQEIQRILQYMDAHRMEHKVWRFIPIDMNLPLSILSICVTYIIVIIQFTHLYD